MKNPTITPAVLLVLLAAKSAAGDTNRFNLIPERNVFSLKTPAIVANAPPPAIPRALVKLTGLTSIPPDKWAFLNIKPEGEAPLVTALKVGESVAAVAVLDINLETRAVAIRNEGVLMTLVFAENQRTPLPPPDAGHRPIPAFPPPDAGER